MVMLAMMKRKQILTVGTNHDDEPSNNAQDERRAHEDKLNSIHRASRHG